MFPFSLKLIVAPAERMQLRNRPDCIIVPHRAGSSFDSAAHLWADRVICSRRHDTLRGSFTQRGSDQRPTVNAASGDRTAVDQSPFLIRS